LKTEGQFNAHLSKEFKRFNPKLKCLKVADKFSVGISDFLLWGNGKSRAIESKFVTHLPVRATTKVLSHPFAGAQLTFLEDICLAGCSGWGLIGIGETKTMHLLMLEDIPKEGNFTKEEFVGMRQVVFGFDEVPLLVDYLFGTLL
jgi:hypothetical protein